MKVRFALIPSLLVATACANAQKPLMLIVQERAVDFTNRDPNIDVMRPLSDALAKTGKVLTCIWSQGDPLVQAAISSGEFKNWTDKPKREGMFAFAKVVGANYVVICRATRATGQEKPTITRPADQIRASAQGGLVFARIEVYGIRKEEIFTDENSVTIMTGSELDEGNTALSVTNSWVTKLATGPMRSVFGAPTISAAEVGPPTVNQHVTETADTQPLATGMQALKENRLAAAITYLRDAVDADPLDPGARLALIEALRKSDKPFLAAEEAARGAALIPGDKALLSAGAAAWLDGEKLDRAYEIVAQAIEANPTDPNANEILGDLFIRRLDFAKSISAYDVALQAGEKAGLRFKRSVANALKGDFDASVKDLEAAQSLGLSQTPAEVAARYADTTRILDAVFQSLSTSMKNLLNDAKASPNDKSIGNRVSELQSKCTAFVKYVDNIGRPDAHSESHAGRGLALNLLVQSVQSVQRFLHDKSGDTEQDARLLQIEAAREYADAIEKYKQELAKIK